MNGRNKILLTGVSGYVGGRLLKILEQSDKYEITCLARKPEYIKSRVSPDTKVLCGDVLNYDSLVSALKNVDIAFYLVHSMGSKKSFEQLDREGAKNFGKAAKKNGVKKIIYLGGLGDSSKHLSPHLQSRHETGEILRQSGVKVIEFRSSIVIGNGSLSFELIRNLVEKLPIMTTPKWVQVKTQPIAVSDLLKYLEKAIELEVMESKIFEIGSPEVVSYRDLMKEYCKQRGLNRIIIPVPVLTPWLSSLWLGLVTPVYARVGRKLVDSLKHPTVISNNSANEYFDIKPMSVADSITNALKEEKDFYQNRWSDSLAAGNTYKTFSEKRPTAKFIDSRTIEVNKTREKAFEPIKKIGGQTGWYYGNWLWKLRSYIDLLVGGVGIRRRRRDPEEIKVGDVIDWWRVEEYRENNYIRLFAEMKIPGEAFLEFNVAGKNGKSTITQTATFYPAGFFGIIYWYILYPVHSLMFKGMLKNIALN
ncbi:MAG: DUF2867 domain-containing protein [Candidatus Dadabacteria bacterium]|nr:DUF2867 domain-containing protein [Candidatus Dadabacteria bacterium]NIT13360.1 DUF2867 domain-containing protein [Candidatus Dadabacteria bacterium]